MKKTFSKATILFVLWLSLFILTYKTEAVVPVQFTLLGGCEDNISSSEKEAIATSLEPKPNSPQIEIIRQTLNCSYEAEDVVSITASLQILNKGAAGDVVIQIPATDMMMLCGIESKDYQAIVKWLEHGDDSVITGLGDEFSESGMAKTMMLANCRAECDGKELARKVQITTQTPDDDHYDASWQGTISFTTNFGQNESKNIVLTYRLGLCMDTNTGCHSFKLYPYYFYDTSSPYNASITIENKATDLLFHFSPLLTPPEYKGKTLIWELKNYPHSVEQQKLFITPLMDNDPFYTETGDLNQILGELNKAKDPYVLVYADSGKIADSVSLVNGLNLRANPSSDAESIKGRQALKAGERFIILSGQDDWIKIETNDGYIGWVRWRYVDENGQVNVYALPNFWGDV